MASALRVRLLGALNTWEEASTFPVRLPRCAVGPLDLEREGPSFWSPSVYTVKVHVLIRYNKKQISPLIALVVRDIKA